MLHANELHRCLVEMDIEGIRRLWRHVAPHLPQPTSDDEALETIHLARVKMKKIHPRHRAYSRRWLKERETVRTLAAVGVSVKPLSNRNRARAEDLQGELSHTVMRAYNDGVDLDEEAPEVKRRMRVVMQKIRGTT